MVICPFCQNPDSDQTAICRRCGQAMFRVPATVLPAPMVEPIHAPASQTSDGDSPSGQLLLRLPSEKGPVEQDASESPSESLSSHSPATVIDLPPPEVSTPDRIPARATDPAIPGLPGLPMSESAVQSPPMTVPATDRADSQPASVPVSAQVRPKLVVLRGLRIDVEYPVYEGRNTIGRFADKPVDIDLMNQESVEQIWCSRQHAVVTCETGIVAVEDLNSLNGTWVNGVRIHPGQRRPLKPGDVLQIGTVQMKLVIA